jgi:riboflavin biosynthesis pyrimidine reductase/flavin reductase (DIM6/NTAB) family NADH-FMN oxidoreductase RutF
MANMVAGVDGSTAVEGRVATLSSPADTELFSQLRSIADCVLVGAGTVRREGYGPIVLPDRLRSRRQATGRSPVPFLAIVTRSLQLDWTSPALVASEPASPTLVVTCEAADPERVEAARRQVEVLVAGRDGVDLRAALGMLGERDVSVVLCEGGPTLLGELVALDALDELCLTLAPLMGGDPLPVAVASKAARTTGSPLTHFELTHALSEDSNLFLRYERRNEDHPGSAGDTLGELGLAVDPTMTVVTAAADGERAGCLVGFHAQCSIGPPRYAVWLSKANHTYRVALRSEHLAVHFLGRDQRHLAERFGGSTGDHGDKFAGLPWRPGPYGTPILEECPHRLVGRRTALFDEGGDHVCVVLDPLEVGAPGALGPLRLSDVEDIEPGHGAGDRPGPPTERAG